MHNLLQFDTNLAVAVASEGGSGVFGRQEDGERLTAIRTATGATVGWSPPVACDPADSGSELHKAARAVRVLTGASFRVAAVSNDARLSEQAKADDAGKLWAEAAIQADRIAEEVEAEVARLDAYEREFLAPPPVTDSVVELRDGEMRQWFRSLPQGDAPGVVEAMASGEHPELLAALMRSPAPLPYGVDQVLPRAWRAHLARTQPDELRAVESRRERLEWLQTIVQQAASAIPRTSAGAQVNRAR